MASFCKVLERNWVQGSKGVNAGAIIRLEFQFIPADATPRVRVGPSAGVGLTLPIISTVVFYSEKLCPVHLVFARRGRSC